MNKAQQVQLHQIRAGATLWKIRVTKIESGHTVIEEVTRLTVTEQPFHILTDADDETRMWFFHTDRGVQTYPFLSKGSVMDEEPSTATAYFNSGSAACQYMNEVISRVHVVQTDTTKEMVQQLMAGFTDVNYAARHEIPNQYFQEK